MLERLINRMLVEGECWIMHGAVNTSGYMQVRIDKKYYIAHRLSYQLFKGDIPNGYQIDHLCKNRRCINPEHLEAVTPRVNGYRSDNISGLNHRKTQCHIGHDFSPENTYITPSGTRNCRACLRLADIRQKGKRRAFR